MDISKIGMDDQVDAAIISMAQMMMKYRKELEAQGFSKKEAWTLIVEYQRAFAPKRE